MASVMVELLSNFEDEFKAIKLAEDNGDVS